MKYYRLEYNPDSPKLFHMDNYTHEENAHGWTTIDKQAEDGAATRFIAYFKKYHTDKRYTPEDVKLMWRLSQGVDA